MNDPVNMPSTVLPKSDQINADDLIAGPRTITVARVTANDGNGEQPVNVYFEGSDKPFRPCKSMRRVMISVWGADASQYVGRAMTIYRDPKVKWGGMEVGGIRIAAMSHLDAPKTMALTESKAARKPYTVQPLKMDAPTASSGGEAEAAEKIIGNIGRAPDSARLEAYFSGKPAGIIEEWKTTHPELAARVSAALDSKRQAFAGEPAWAGEVSAIRDQIRAATTSAALEKAVARLDRHRLGLPDDVTGELDALVTTQRQAIAS